MEKLQLLMSQSHSIIPRGNYGELTGYAASVLATMEAAFKHRGTHHSSYCDACGLMRTAIGAVLCASSDALQKPLTCDYRADLILQCEPFYEENAGWSTFCADICRWKDELRNEGCMD